ncbi:MAG: glycosyltransferase family 2 protein [Verrucomicrobiota bacterium]|jgi:glycosyltransferase involved in cell wall biosynthesis
MELTILMPCLNEAETLAACIQKARLGLARAGVQGEVLIADNGSTDGSVAIAEKLGARVVLVKEKGYGSALRGGIEAARGQWVMMGDADDSYDFSKIEGFVQKFREGYDLVMGCRLPSGGGTILPGAMPWKNHWIGNPILSLIGRVFFNCPARDFHCGLRGFTREAYGKMDLKTTGMEFASEMVIKATLKSLRIAEVPITLHPDGRSRPPHLKPWRDGWRHLRFMLIYSPRWLFLMPGLALAIVGLVCGAALAVRPLRVGGIAFDAGTLAVASLFVIIGGQLVAFAFFTKVFAIGEGLLPQDAKFSKVFHYFNLEKGIALGLLLLLLGLGLLGRALWIWKEAGFGILPFGENLRRLIPAVTLITLGIQIVFSSFFLSILGLKTDARHPPST